MGASVARWPDDATGKWTGNSSVPCYAFPGVNIDHSTRRCRFEYRHDGVEAYLYYERLGDILDIRATFVPRKFRGQGIGRKLAQAAVDYAREHTLTVRPTCPFVQRLIEADKIS